jgi:peptidoglycan/LPS O-acetylase OafA/YrhL
MNKDYIHNLTALRGIAALLVAILHFHFFLGNIVPSHTTGLVDKFYLMVDLFFILSGFIICYVYCDTFNTKIKLHDYQTFLTARFARIYPLHCLTLITEVFIFIFILSVDKFDLLPKWHQHLYRLDAIPIQLTFLQTVGIFNFDTWNAPAWSLSAEWWAYIIFPLLFIPISRFKLKWIPIFSILVISMWLSIEFFLSPLQPFLNYPANAANISLDVNWHYGTLRGITGFAAGMIIWRLYNLFIHRLKNTRINDYIILGATLLVLLSMHFKWYDTITVTIFSIIIFFAALGGDKMNKFFSIGCFQKLGDWSFSIYIWHMVVINLITTCFLINRTDPIEGILKPFNDVGSIKYVLLILFLILVSIIGSLSYKFIEKPTRKWIRNKIK